MVFAIAALLALGVSVLPAAAHDRTRGWGNGHGDHHRPGREQFTNTVFVNGATITHPGPNGSEAISQPDDITYLDGHIFVGFQNGVGPQGQPSTTGNHEQHDRRVQPARRRGNQWDVVGKCDGLTADPRYAAGHRDRQRGRELEPVSDRPATVPGRVVALSRITSRCPPTEGTDAIKIYHGLVLISASAPGTTGAAAPQPNYPAVYGVVLDFSATDRHASSPVLRRRLSDLSPTSTAPSSVDRVAGADRPRLQRGRSRLRASLRRRLHAHQPGRQAADLRPATPAVRISGCWCCTCPLGRRHRLAVRPPRRDVHDRQLQ